MSTSDTSADSSGEGAGKPIPPGTFGFGFAPNVSRRALLAGSGALALSAFLAACGGDDDDAVTDTTSGGADTTAPADTAAPGTTGGTGETTATDAPSAAGTAAAEAQT